PELADALAELLRESPTRASPLRRASETPLPVDLDTRLHLMRVEDEPFLTHEPIFAPAVARGLEQLILERGRPDELLRAGLHPTRSALFIGPPGVGKTLAARYLARELRRPLLILDLAAVMSSYLGRTGNNVRLVLDYAKSVNCVLLLDELDAIAKRRDDGGEIGELKRLVTVLIQQIDDWPPSGLLIAASNHAGLLDPAIWRRFELTLEFPLPNREAVDAFARAALAPHMKEADAWAHILSIALDGKPFSEIERVIVSARRNAALNGALLPQELAKALDVDALPKSARIELANKLIDADAVSQRQASEITGIARDTIRTHRRDGDRGGDRA
ncbi:MAG: ATPase AAA, partial [Alphaproteobacteria bacterium]